MITDKSGVVGCAEDELGSAIIPGTDITDIGFSSHENLCATKITQFENPTSRIQE